MNKFSLILFFLSSLIYSGCTPMNAAAEPGNNKNKLSVLDVTDASKAISVNADTFVCLKKMHPVRGFFVTNILGNLDATIAAAMSENGASYPAGSVVQLIPEEVMIKHQQGWNSKTHDWEFFELEISEEGTKIKVRGTTQVINKFGGNCFECHQKAQPQWDLICEKDHGCDSLPIPDFVIHWVQNSDPRCD